MIIIREYHAINAKYSQNLNVGNLTACCYTLNDSFYFGLLWWYVVCWRIESQIHFALWL